MLLWTTKPPNSLSPLEEIKIAAPESVLKERDPGFYQAYEARLERLEMNEQDNSETLIDLSSGPHESIHDALEE